MIRLMLRSHLLGSVLLIGTGLILIVAVIAPLASGASLMGSSLTLSDSRASESGTYKVQFSLPDASATLGSVELDFCANSALFTDICVPPAGMDAASASLVAQNGAAGFSITTANPNQIIISRPPSAAGASQLAYQFSGVTNPETDGAYFLRIQVFSGEEASGDLVARGALAFAINLPVNVKAEVPPYIAFCVGVTVAGYNCAGASGSYVEFGELTATAPATGTEQLLAATNAINGYTISVLGQTMTSGNNIIAPLAIGAPSIPGTSQFGLNLVTNTSPRVGAAPSGPGSGPAPATGYGESNSFRFDSGEVIASSPTSSDYKKFTASFIVNRPAGQAPGYYATTLTFVALGNF